MEETSIDQSVRTRWRTDYMMGSQLLTTKQTIIDFDRKHVNPGEAWDKNKLGISDWDWVEERFWEADC